MATNQDRLSTLQASLEFILRDYLTTEEAATFFQALKGAIDTTRQELNQKIDARLATLRDGVDGNTPTRDDILALIRPLIPQVKDGRTPTAEELRALITPLIPAPLAPPTKEAIAGDLQNSIEQRLPQFGTIFRDALELLQGDERLKASAIDGLDQQIEDIRTLASKRIQTPAKAYRLHLVDLSSQCDGANKTFYVGGSHFGITGVWSTQFPASAFLPLVDFTETATGFVFTDQVTAPESGQSLIAQFLK